MERNSTFKPFNFIKLYFPVQKADAETPEVNPVVQHDRKVMVGNPLLFPLSCLLILAIPLYLRLSIPLIPYSLRHLLINNKTLIRRFAPPSPRGRRHSTFQLFN
jgi:hypothetical protein